MSHVFKTYTILSISSASLSILASSVIALGLKPFHGGLSSPYRRIVFCLSISDLTQSLSIVTGPFAVPSSHPLGAWAVGNYQTCQADGFLFIVGSFGAQLYMFMLCLYTAVKICTKDSRRGGLGMTDETFNRKIERPMHLFIFLSSVSVASYGLAKRAINASFLGNVCLFAQTPPGCRQRPDLFGECDPTVATVADNLTIVHNFVVPIFCIFGIICCMTKVCWSVFHVSLQFERCTRHQQTNLELISSSSEEENPRSSHELSSEQDRIIKRGQECYEQMKRFRREIVIQACCFILAFLATFSIYWYCVMMIFLDGTPPSWSIYAAYTLYPLGGLFNMLAYSRPRIITLRLKHPNYSWFRALWVVMKAGTDVVDLPELDVVSAPDKNSEESLAFRPLRQKQNLSNLSGEGMYDGSESFDKGNIAYRSQNDWQHNIGGGLSSGLAGIFEMEDQSSLSNASRMDDQSCSEDDDESGTPKSARNYYYTSNCL